MKVHFYIERLDRLGNWLFRLAVAASLSDEVAICAATAEDLERMKRYALFSGLEGRVGLPPGVRVYQEPRFAYDPIPMPSEGKEFVLRGYFQSWRYFDERKVRRLIRIPDEDRTRLESEYAEALSQPDITAIGVRRGDYLKLPHRFPFVGKRYYRKALERLSDVRNFLVCSDDIAWCRRFFNERNFPGRRFHFSQAQRDIDDIWLQALCKNNILANSSFSWWGGYLNATPGKRTVAPSRWFGWDFKRKGYDWSDVYYPGTEIVDNDSSWLRSAGDALCTLWIQGIRPKVISPPYQWVRRRICG